MSFLDVQSAGTSTSHTEVVHVGGFESVRTLRECVHCMPVTGTIMAKFDLISYGSFIRFSFVLVIVSETFGYRVCFIKVICFSL